MAEPSQTPETLIAAISKTGNAASQGWMSIFAGMPFGNDAAAWLSGVAADPERFAALQRELIEKQSQLWSGMLARNNGAEFAALAQTDKGDRRFAAREWRSEEDATWSTAATASSRSENASSPSPEG